MTTSSSRPWPNRMICLASQNSRPERPAVVAQHTEAAKTEGSRSLCPGCLGVVLDAAMQASDLTWYRVIDTKCSSQLCTTYVASIVPALLHSRSEQLLRELSKVTSLHSQERLQLEVSVETAWWQRGTRKVRLRKGNINSPHRDCDPQWPLLEHRAQTQPAAMDPCSDGCLTDLGCAHVLC